MTSEEQKEEAPANSNTNTSASTYSLREINRYDSPVSQLTHNAQLDIYQPAHQLRRSGIICTIGPASQSTEMLVKLINAGMDVVRLNFSHGTHEYHIQTIANAREAAKITGENIAIALDTKGPEIRTGNFVNDAEVTLTLGDKVRLTVDPAKHDTGTVSEFYVDYPNIVNVAEVGKTVYIDDGLVALRIDAIGGDYLETTVVNSGCVSNHKGVNLPNCNVDLPAISEKDRRDLTLGVKMDVDMVFASFIRKQQDIIDTRKVLTDADPVKGARIQIIAKVENHEGMQKFDSILDMIDGVMVARGDLGIEIEPQKVFLAQKMMISKCNLVSKPVIVATHMLESMKKNPRPTRAEVSDVANSVLDGADCVMLSGESASGKYPVQAVTIMASICREAETARNSYQYFTSMRAALPKPMPTPETVAAAAVLASFEQHASAMIVLTNSGKTARIVAKFQPPCPIIAVVGESCSMTARQLRITVDVFSVTYDDAQGKKTTDERVEVGLAFGREKGWIAENQFVIAVHADTMGKGFANLVKIIAT